MSHRRAVIAVIGRGDEHDEWALDCAAALGRGIVGAGHRLVTGGKGGVMAAACRGARSSSRWSDGDVLGILPSTDRSEANEFCDIVIPTGLGLARNVLVVSTADVVVAIGGGSGTLSELALAWQIGRPIIAVCRDDGVRGWADRLAGERIDDRRVDMIHASRSAEDAVAQIETVLER